MDAAVKEAMEMLGGAVNAALGHATRFQLVAAAFGDELVVVVPGRMEPTSMDSLLDGDVPGNITRIARQFGYELTPGEAMTYAMGLRPLRGMLAKLGDGLVGAKRVDEPPAPAAVEPPPAAPAPAVVEQQVGGTADAPTLVPVADAPDAPLVEGDAAPTDATPDPLVITATPAACPSCTTRNIAQCEHLK